MTNEEFKNKWGGVEADNLNEKDFAAFKNDCFLLYESNGWKDRFHSPYESEHENNGKPFTVLRRATTDECHVEQLPCWRIRFDDGKETFAFPEEICKDGKEIQNTMTKRIIYRENIILQYPDGSCLATVINDGGEVDSRLCPALDGAKAWIDRQLAPKDGEGKPFTVRFYRKAWTDIRVTARDEEEAIELAEEKYNSGDYEDDDESWENTDCEIVDNVPEG